MDHAIFGVVKGDGRELRYKGTRKQRLKCLKCHLNLLNPFAIIFTMKFRNFFPLYTLVKDIRIMTSIILFENPNIR